jgi:hypothetical protein
MIFKSDFFFLVTLYSYLLQEEQTDEVDCEDMQPLYKICTEDKVHIHNFVLIFADLQIVLFTSSFFSILLPCILEKK